MFNKKEYMREYNKKYRKKHPNYNRDYKRKYRLEHQEKIKEQDRLFRERHKEDKVGKKRKEQKKKWEKENKEKLNKNQLERYHNNLKGEKEKHRARNRAFKNIEIPKNQICEDCKLNKATTRHHEDYNKPLEVIFLCDNCNQKSERTERGK
jgi:hypothetical protein